MCIRSFAKAPWLTPVLEHGRLLRKRCLERGLSWDKKVLGRSFLKWGFEVFYSLNLPKFPKVHFLMNMAMAQTSSGSNPISATTNCAIVLPTSYTSIRLSFTPTSPKVLLSSAVKVAARIAHSGLSAFACAWCWWLLQLPKTFKILKGADPVAWIDEVQACHVPCSFP